MAGLSVEALPDAGAPQVGITVDGLDGAAVISVEVSWDGGESWHGVRGAQRVEVVGGAFFRDHVPPLNVEARYRLVVHSGTLLPRFTYAWDGTEGLSTSTEYVDGAVTRRNLIAYPSADAGAGSLAGWVARAAGGLSVGGAVEPATGRRYFRVAATAATGTAFAVGADVALAYRPEVVPGEPYSASLYLRAQNASYSARMTAYFLDGSDAQVGSSLPSAVTAGSNWQRVSVSGIAPADATRLLVRVGNANAFGVGNFLDYTAVQVEGSPEPTPYFDGDAPDVDAPTEATITVTSDTAWLQDPLNPRTAVAIRADSPRGGDQLLTYGALTSAAWTQAVDYAIPMGARLPVASVGQRIMAGEVPLVVSHDVAAEGGALRRLLLSSGQLVVRGLPGDLLEPVAHIVVGDATEQRVGGRAQVSTWELTAHQARPTSMRIVVPWFTYQQVQEMWAGMSYDDVLAARPGDTYLDWQRDPTVP